METEIIPLADLHAPARNVRLHPDAQIVELARAIEMFGQTRPVVIDETNTVLAGNGLVMALTKLGRSQAVVLRMNGLSHGAKTKLMLSDNKIYALGHDDYDGIMTLIRGLDTEDLNIPGYDANLLTSLLASDAAAAASLDEFGRMTDQEKADRAARPAQTIKVGAETRVICPHCGKEFPIQ